MLKKSVPEEPDIHAEYQLFRTVQLPRSRALLTSMLHLDLEILIEPRYV